MMRSIVVFAALAAVAGGAAAIVTTEGAQAASSCPTVTIPVGQVGTVSPAPTPGVDWSGCDLAGVSFSGTTLTDVNFSGANLSGTAFFGTKITGSDLSKTNLEQSDLSNAVITNTSLAGADISLASFNVATLTGARSGGLTDPKGAPDLDRAWLLRDGYLLGPNDDFSGTDFASLAVKPNLTGWDLDGSDFTGSNLTGMDLDGDNLSNAQFGNANLTKANLYGDNLAGTTLQGANLTGSTLTGVESGGITGTPAALPANWSIRGGYLVGPKAILVSANLSGVDLTGADLAGANLYLGDLTGANFTNANLTGTGALDDVDVTGAIWSNTTCPDGTNSDNDGGTCVNNNDDQPPQARPAISGPVFNSWYSRVTVTWNWIAIGGPLDPARCPASTTSTTEGAPAVITATCWNVEGLKGTASVSVDIDNTGPKVVVTGVKAGLVYAAGHVPVAGCRTTDALSGVLQNARLTVTTAGAHGVGAFTATCAGGINNVDIQAAPVKAAYTVAWGLSGVTAPKNKSTVARSAHSFPVTIKLSKISAGLAAKLAAAGAIRATLSGPGISPVTVSLKWQPKTGTFTARLPIPAKAQAGQNYQITIRENVGTGLLVAPRLGTTVNPVIVRFK